MTDNAAAQPTVASLGTGIMGAGMGRNLARAALRVVLAACFASFGSS